MPREPLRCPDCNRFLGGVEPHPDNNLELHCHRCKSRVFLKGSVITSLPRARRSRLLGEEWVDMDIKIRHVSGS